MENSNAKFKFLFNQDETELNNTFNSLNKILDKYTLEEKVQLSTFIGLCGSVCHILKPKFHNLYGPAFEHVNGVKHYYINGIQFTEEEYTDILNRFTPELIESVIEILPLVNIESEFSESVKELINKLK